MSTVDSPTLTSELAETVHTKLRSAAGPLTLAELLKPKPKNKKPGDYQNEVQAAVDDLILRGLAFSYPSGKNALDRYWSQDEKQLLRVKAMELAAAPQPLSKFSTALGKVVKKVDKTFVETVVRELIGHGQLFEYAPATKAGGPRFGTAPPPPPMPVLEQPKHKKTFDKLVVAAEKLLVTAQVPAEELVRLLRERLIPTSHTPASPGAKPTPAPPAATASLRSVLRDAYETLCLYIEFDSGVVEIPRLYHEARKAMPSLTVHAFHQELETLWSQKVLELKVLNEVRSAKEPDKAIRRGDNLYYFVFWPRP